MTNATQLWREFLAFCDVRTPDDLLAMDFLRTERGIDAADASERRQAARDLRTLQLLLTWRERNEAVREIASCPARERCR